ncbi:MAG: hypothetical protein CL862_05560 [Cyanobium sp. NAT70]|nr:hypothetical protein [Cyanobium sp. NAT70]
MLVLSKIRTLTSHRVEKDLIGSRQDGMGVLSGFDDGAIQGLMRALLERVGMCMVWFLQLPKIHPLTD